jgi:RimJ/RimL family protein N-acetyltransferase
MPENLITTWYLRYQGPQLPMPHLPAASLLMEATLPSPDLNQFLFSAVGNHWRWFSRLNWSYQQWLDYLSTDDVRTWVLYQAGSIAGFIELNYHPENENIKQAPSVELKFFGLLPAFTGGGLGPKLAQAAIALAQQWLANRMPTVESNVWVHTCSADHPAALTTYQKAGFAIYETTAEPAEIPSDYAEAILCRNYIQSRLAHFTTK